MKRIDFYIRIWMLDKSEFTEIVQANDIDTVIGYLEQEFADEIKPFLRLWNKAKRVNYYRKNSIMKIVVDQLPESK